MVMYCGKMIAVTEHGFPFEEMLAAAGKSQNPK